MNTSKYLKIIMEHGFLIYGYPDGQQPRPKFVLRKVDTFSDDTEFQTEYVNAFDEALAKALKHIGGVEFYQFLDEQNGVCNNKEPEPAKTPSTHQSTHPWMAQLMYRHKGFGPRFEDLGIVEGTSYDDAVAKAKECAEKHVTDIIGEDIVEGWDVRVRPCDK